MAPDSRRSDIKGRLSVRSSTLRDNCDRAMMGTCSSLDSDLIAREISETSVARFSFWRVTAINWM